jgi:hypothetical protein
VLAVGPAAATMDVDDVDSGPPRGAVGISGSGQHQSWRRQWRAPRGVLAVGPTATTTDVDDVDDEPPRGAVEISGSGHHRSWRRRWWAPWVVLAAGPAAATTDVENVDDGAPGGCCRDFRQRPPPILKTSMAGPLRGADGRSGNDHHQSWRHQWRAPGGCWQQVRQWPPRC